MKRFASIFQSQCTTCGAVIAKGADVYWSAMLGGYCSLRCVENAIDFRVADVHDRLHEMVRLVDRLENAGSLAQRLDFIALRDALDDASALTAGAELVVSYVDGQAVWLKKTRSVRESHRRIPLAVPSGAET